MASHTNIPLADTTVAAQGRVRAYVSIIAGIASQPRRRRIHACGDRSQPPPRTAATRAHARKQQKQQARLPAPAPPPAHASRRQRAPAAVGTRRNLVPKPQERADVKRPAERAHGGACGVEITVVAAPHRPPPALRARQPPPRRGQQEQDAWIALRWRAPAAIAGASRGPGAREKNERGRAGPITLSVIRPRAVACRARRGAAVQLPSPPMPPSAQLAALLAHAPRRPGGQRSTRTAEAAREANNGRSRKMRAHNSATSAWLGTRPLRRGPRCR
jgi:hypothetical protein